MRFLLVVLLALAACGGAQRRSAPPIETQDKTAQRGLASWYGGRFNGRLTASGERFDEDELTGAHRTLKFGTRVRVTNERNGRQVVVRINDRGPYGKGRIIDVSRAAAVALDMVSAGVVPVAVEILR